MSQTSDLTPGETAALNAMRSIMDKTKCSPWKAYTVRRGELKREKAGDGLRRRWADEQPAYEVAYAILAKEAK